MLKFLFRIAIRHNLATTLRIASKLEYGAGIFCKKLAKKAMKDGYPALSDHFAKQAAEEDSHAKMLGGIVDGKSRLKRNCPAGMASYKIGYEAFEGISQRYWAAKLFFWFKNPQELDWADTLAFIHVIEEIVAQFYGVLSESEDEGVSAIAIKILGDELSHSNYLKHCLWFFHAYPAGVITKWQDRLPLAVLGASFDIVFSTFKCV